MKTNFKLSYLLLPLAGLVALPATAVYAGPNVSVSLGFKLPHGFVDVSVGRDHYYENRGVFYRRGNHGLVRVRAPHGAVVRRLPPYYTRIYVGGVIYYRANDIYYAPASDGYMVVDPPRKVVEAAPVAPAPKEEGQSVWVGKQEYIFQDGQFFSKTADGLVWEEAPLGGITKSLPDDAKSIWYQQVEYYEVDGIYFKKTPEGYKVVMAPWKG